MGTWKGRHKPPTPAQTRREFERVLKIVYAVKYKLTANSIRLFDKEVENAGTVVEMPQEERINPITDVPNKVEITVAVHSDWTTKA
ncbi:hypothetical protein CLAFUW4_05157 [Fulvia fulva]|uniref:Uncharacterized protein n=1 Tax=Passalora fulva TaxID=5499 RepID=A0A9Q8PHD5_PASFU|nr:uncharacterized protein CLAFUR5_11749 [Fulvia fulva]KAK4626041.1 hypothetical protein CLAFUR4_05143 [Fulvia fulva]KAK4628181.1 hypothetical protein CLAFUR0_05149 [Fulvia fulva]UJO22498.1 hypothetical protein CLAFUR5_11749 [Fulvia fulva]WPV13425.1 hypothetical protein CLAFUW4_05157 [Fulvia fulva]WPV28081.1 hypothetical protein CLAFUW7_05153 [Fulvia fulva]